jgi:mono/diheme cytochrome c family protein
MRRGFLTFAVGLLCLILRLGSVSAQPLEPPAQIQLFGQPIPRPGNHPLTHPLTGPVTLDFPTLVFDADSKEYDAKPSERIAPFTFHLTNVWSNEIIIMHVQPSCGCTTVQLPPTPWHLPPHGTGVVTAQVDLTAKPPGMITKTLTFLTAVGSNTVNYIASVNVRVPSAAPAGATMSPAERKAAMAQAAANPRAIFQGDCAKCHVDKGKGLLGAELYSADCGICHDSARRDGAVPDLHALKHPANLDFWTTVISLGKPHTMMPGFAARAGGPLDDAQVASLAAYLDRTMSPPATNAAPPVNTHF